MARVLIVGLGYVGSALGAQLASEGYEVFGTRREPATFPGVQIVPLSLTDRTELSVLPDRLDAVFFTAAPDESTESSYRAVYVDGLRRIAEHVGGRAPIYFTSSTSVYGQSDGSAVDETSETRPASFRGEILLEAESIATKVLRLAGLYGPGRTRALDSLRSGGAEVDRARYLNLIHRDDAASALIHLMRLGDAERLFVGVDCEPTRGEELYGWLAREAGTREPKWGARSGSNKRLTSRRLRDSGYQFVYPSFREGYRVLMRSEELAPCPSSPNCVSTVDPNPDKRVSALGFRVPFHVAVAEVEQALRELGGEIGSVDVGRIEATFTSRLFRFVDDVVVVVDPTRERVDYRSASRVGHSDLGVNRRRMARLAERLAARPGFFVLDQDEVGS